MIGTENTSTERHVALRLALFCAAVFAGIGVYAPFWPVWLDGRGMTETQIAVLISIPSWIRVVSAPAFTALADRTGRRRRITRRLAWAAMASFAVFAACSSFAALFVVSIAFGCAFTALVPMSDQSILACSRQYRLQYGRVRLWGSLSFLAMAIAAGHFLEERTSSVVYVAVLLCLAATVVTVYGLPQFDTPPAPQDSRPSVKEALRLPGFARLLTAYGLVMGSHATLGAFSALHWRGAGIGDDTVGYLWAEGVVAEIVLFAIGARAVSRFGPRGLLIAAGLVGVVRWSGIAVTTDVPSLYFLQAMHAFTFGACHLAMMEHVTQRVPARLSTIALGLGSATSGLFNSILTLASGPLYHRFGGGAFFAMAGAAAIGFVLVVPRLPADTTNASAT